MGFWQWLGFGKKDIVYKLHPDEEFLKKILLEFAEKVDGKLDGYSAHRISEGIIEYGQVVRKFNLRTFGYNIGRAMNLAEAAYVYRKKPEVIPHTCRCLGIVLGLIRMVHANPEYAAYFDLHDDTSRYVAEFLTDIEFIKGRLRLIRGINLKEFSQYIDSMSATDLSSVQIEMLDKIAIRFGRP